jgi:hypothetical protein
MSTSSTSFTGYLHSAKDFVTRDPARLSAVSNLVLCTAVTQNPVHGIVCATLAFLISKITKFIRTEILPHVYKLDTWSGKITSALLATAVTRFCILNPLAELGFVWKVNLLGTGIIAAVFLAVAQPIAEVSRGYFGGIYDIIPFIPR